MTNSTPNSMVMEKQPAEWSCPVCRAKQTMQATCRRCQADLALYLKAVQSREATIANGDGSARKYLQWLSPKDCLSHPTS